MSGLNNHLFAQLERLSDGTLCGNKLSEEIERASAVLSVAEQIISCGSLVLRAQVARDRSISGSVIVPKILE